MLDRLIEAVDTVAIPGAPPPMSRTGAQIGLAFLDTVLRQNHTRRLSEDVTLDQRGRIQRSIRQEVCLTFLTSVQVDAGQQYGTYRVARENAGSAQSHDEPANGLWLPLSRVSRRDSPSVQVRDDTGRYIPTLTRAESSELFAPALYRLLRRIIETNVATAVAPQLGDLLENENEARWLLQRAIISLVTERAPAVTRRPTAGAAGIAPATGGRQRAIVRNALEELHSHGELDQFLELLTIAVDQQVLIAYVKAANPDQELTYDVPVGQRRARQTGWRSPLHTVGRWIFPTADHLIAYDTEIPSGVTSYHFTATTDAASQVSDAVLLVHARAGQIDRLSTDLDFLAGRVAEHSNGQLSAARVKLLEFELQNALKTLAELVRQRLWESSWQRIATRPGVLDQAITLASAVQRGEGPVDASSSASVVHASLLAHPLVSAETLTAVSHEIRRSGVGREITLNPARSREANLTWRRVDSDDGRRSAVRITCLLRIVDGAETSRLRVFSFGAALSVIAYVVLSASFGSLAPWRWIRAGGALVDVGPKVSILLLVPGFLYSRMRVAREESLAAVLRRGPSALAVIMIAAVVGVALSIVVADSHRGVGSEAALVCFVVLVLASARAVSNRLGAGRLRRVWNRLTRSGFDPLPPWVADGRRLLGFRRQPDAAFDGVRTGSGGTHD